MKMSQTMESQIEELISEGRIVTVYAKDGFNFTGVIIENQISNIIIENWFGNDIIKEKKAVMISKKAIVTIESCDT